MGWNKVEKEAAGGLEGVVCRWNDGGWGEILRCLILSLGGKTSSLRENKVNPNPQKNKKSQT